MMPIPALQTRPRLLLPTLFLAALCLGATLLSIPFLGPAGRARIVHYTAYALCLLLVMQLLRALRWYTVPVVSPIDRASMGDDPPILLLPEDYRKLRSQIAAASRDRRVFQELLRPRLECLLAQRQTGAAGGSPAMVLHGEAAALWQGESAPRRWRSHRVPLPCLTDLLHQLEQS